jgi:hypothetical protein
MQNYQNSKPKYTVMFYAGKNGVQLLIYKLQAWYIFVLISAYSLRVCVIGWFIICYHAEHCPFSAIYLICMIFRELALQPVYTWWLSLHWKVFITFKCPSHVMQIYQSSNVVFIFSVKFQTLCFVSLKWVQYILLPSRITQGLK